jgi:hypothetical protein
MTGRRLSKKRERIAPMELEQRELDQREQQLQKKARIANNSGIGTANNSQTAEKARAANSSSIRAANNPRTGNNSKTWIWIANNSMERIKVRCKKHPTAWRVGHRKARMAQQTIK